MCNVYIFTTKYRIIFSNFETILLAFLNWIIFKLFILPEPGLIKNHLKIIRTISNYKRNVIWGMNPFNIQTANLYKERIIPNKLLWFVRRYVHRGKAV